MYVIFQKKRPKKMLKKGKIFENLGKNENILKKGRWFRAFIAGNKLLEKAHLPSGLFSIQQMLVALL